MSLIDKLDNVQIEPLQVFEDIDQTALVFHEPAYLRALDDVNRWEAAVGSLANGGEWLTEQVERSQREVRDAREAAAKTFVLRTLLFFERRYSLTLRPQPLWELASKRLDEEGRDLTQPLITPEEIGEYILERLGGHDFHDAAVQELKEKFKDRLIKGPPSDRYIGVEQKGRVVRLERYLYLGTHFDGSPHLTHNSDQYLGLLQRALSHFEDPRVTATIPQVQEAFPNQGGYRDNPVREYGFQDCERITSLTIYKNGNVALKFPSNELAIEFCRHYDLLTL